MNLTLAELEEAINYWRTQCPSSGEESALSPEVNALAEIYALMIYQRQKSIEASSLSAKCSALLQSWRAQSSAPR